VCEPPTRTDFDNSKRTFVVLVSTAVTGLSAIQKAISDMLSNTSQYNNGYFSEYVLVAFTQFSTFMFCSSVSIAFLNTHR
jgi:hypothetical protein